MDINNAFLNGHLKEIIYISQPEGFVDSSKPHHVCKLLKALYGLKQTPKAWYDAFKGFLVTFGFQNSQVDHCLFYKRTQHNILILLVLCI